MKRLIVLLLLFLSVNANAAFVCGDHTRFGITQSPDAIGLCRIGYALSYLPDRKIPEWAIYHVTSVSVNAKQERSNDFREDFELNKKIRSTLNDYKNSGYDRGHIVPNATVDFSFESMSESFLLSNMTPQSPEFNRNGWKDLEEYVREKVNERGELFVITGTICNEPYSTIGKDKVYIPDYYYKILFDPIRLESITFLVPHMNIKKSQFRQFIVSIDTIEELTGIDFFNRINAFVSNDIEASIQMELW